MSDLLAEGEAELFRRYRTGEVECRDVIFRRHISLVEAITSSYARARPGEREDLLQVGYLGLLGALERFDPERGVRFATYAGHCIHGEIRHFVRDKGEVIRRPRWMRQLSSRVALYIEGFQQANERLPTLAEISSALNIAEDGIVAILQAKVPVSLEAEQGRSFGVEAIRSLRQVSFQLPIEDRIVIGQAFEKLLEMEKKVVYLFFVQDLSQRQIAGALSLPPRKVSRLMQSGLARLRGLMNSDEFANSERK